MVNNPERRRVLDTSCRWCGAAPGEECSAVGSKFPPVPLTTLEGGFHDTRMRDAIGRGAAVVTSAAIRAEEPEETPEPVLIGAGQERPW